MSNSAVFIFNPYQRLPVTATGRLGMPEPIPKYQPLSLKPAGQKTTNMIYPASDQFIGNTPATIAPHKNWFQSGKEEVKKSYLISIAPFLLFQAWQVLNKPEILKKNPALYWGTAATLYSSFLVGSFTYGVCRVKLDRKPSADRVERALGELYQNVIPLTSALSTFAVLTRLLTPSKIKRIKTWVLPVGIGGLLGSLVGEWFRYGKNNEK